MKEATKEDGERRKVRCGRRSGEDSPGGELESSPSQTRESRLCFPSFLLSLAKYGEDGALMASAGVKDSLFGLVATNGFTCG